VQWEQDSMTNIRFGRLNLVDLAGSERYGLLKSVLIIMYILGTIKYKRYLKRILTDMMLVCVLRQKSSGAEGERLKEAANINKSLSTLG
jgi:kinesin family protein 15